MAPDANVDASAKTASKKKRKNKKKSADKSGTSDAADKTHTLPNGGAADANDEEEEDGEDDQPEPSPMIETQPATPQDESTTADAAETPEQSTEATTAEATELPVRNGSAKAETDTTEAEVNDIKARLDAAEKDREALKSEVTELRKLLEAQSKQGDDLASVKQERDEAQAAKEKADAQYQTLLGRVNTIRSQLGERLKADAEELANARSQIDELEGKNAALKKAQEESEETAARLQKEIDSHKGEVDSLRSRSNLSTTNWSKERDDLVSQLAASKEEFENAKQAMQDWEVLAMEERSLREALGEKVGELEEQVMSSREAYDRAAMERDMLNSTVEGLQRALQEIQDARKKELRETVESSQAQLEALRKQADEAAKKASEAASQLETTQKELERALPFEKEVKEKNLLIGKLRHEAVILNDHLTKALRFLKRGKPEDNVDRQIVTNHFLQFLALDRSDPKKFQILQLIAALLGWTEEQREQAGLSRPGASNTSLRAPLSPFRRTPSTPSLSSEFHHNNGTSRESLAELWSEFLEREAEAGPGTSRRGSAAPSVRSASLFSPRSEAPGLGIQPVPEE